MYNLYKALLQDLQQLIKIIGIIDLILLNKILVWDNLKICLKL